MNYRQKGKIRSIVKYKNYFEKSKKISKCQNCRPTWFAMRPVLSRARFTESGVLKSDLLTVSGVLMSDLLTGSRVLTEVSGRLERSEDSSLIFPAQSINQTINQWHKNTYNQSLSINQRFYTEMCTCNYAVRQLHGGVIASPRMLELGGLG